MGTLSISIGTDWNILEYVKINLSFFKFYKWSKSFSQFLFCSFIFVTADRQTDAPTFLPDANETVKIGGKFRFSKTKQDWLETLNEQKIEAKLHVHLANIQQ